MKLGLAIILVMWLCAAIYLTIIVLGIISPIYLMSWAALAGGATFFSIILWKERKWNSEARKSSGTSPHLSSNPLLRSMSQLSSPSLSPQQYQQQYQQQSQQLGAAAFSPSEPQPKPTVRQEIAVSPIVGWRLWNIEVGTASDETMTRTQLAARGTAVAPSAVSPLHDVATGTSMPHLLLALADKIESGQDIAQALRAMVKVRLMSANQEPWEKGRAARCGINGQSHGDHIQPDPQCACGYWALRSREAVHHRFFGGFRAGGPCAIGTVELWGKVIEHEHGWRGEYARPKQITVYNTEQWVADAIAREWECEVTRA